MKNKKTIRVRFAPSPTGYPHLGSLRTALCNYLYARGHEGAFLVRIEDTDMQRSDAKYEQAMMQILAWADLMPDEPVIRQSARIEAYQAAAQQLLESGLAYRCDCSLEDIHQRVGKIGDDGTLYSLYDGYCQHRIVSPDVAHVIRIKWPSVDLIVVNDLIKGSLSFKSEQFDDFIIIRSDGFPTYNFAVVIDDIYQNISHIIRGEEHLINTPKQIILYLALKKDIPHFAHLPLILNTDGSKLSKRDSASDALAYIIRGIVPDGLCNYIARLGWAYQDKEIFTRDELIALFDLDGVAHHGAMFDEVKLLWVNQQHLMTKQPLDIMRYMQQWMGCEWNVRYQGWSQDQILFAIRLYITRVSELWSLLKEIDAVYRLPAEYDAYVLTPPVGEALSKLYVSCHQETYITHETAKLMLQQTGVSLKELGPAVRIALTGKLHAPGLFALMELLGASACAQRIAVYLTMKDFSYDRAND